MKKLLSVTAIIFGVLFTFAQAPEKFSYQAVIRNASNALVTNAPVGMKISILKSSAAGTVVYAETQTATTNVNGLVSIQIGAGALVTGTIAGINWGADSYYIKTETDPAGGTNYSIAGTSQLLSVPYAMYSKSSGSGGASFTLPYAGTSSADNVIPFKITNTSATLNQTGAFESTNSANTAPTLTGKNNSTGNLGIGVQGTANSNTNANFSAGVKGIISGTGTGGAGVFGEAQNAFAVYGNTVNGYGVVGYSVGSTGTAGVFQADNGGTALYSYGPIILANVGEAAGKVLTSDVAGNATWQDNSTPFIHFSCTGGSSQEIPVNSATIINTWAGLEETGGANYNPSTGEYTIPITGYYKIIAKVNFSYPNEVNGDPAGLFLKVDDVNAQITYTNSAVVGTYYTDPFLYLEKKLTAGQKVKIVVFQHGSPTVKLYRFGSTFSVDLLHK